MDTDQSKYYRSDYGDAIKQCVSIKTSYLPVPNDAAGKDEYHQTYRVFNVLYDTLSEVFILNSRNRMG